MNTIDLLQAPPAILSTRYLLQKVQAGLVRLLGMLLIAAAAIKLYGLTTGPLEASGFLAHPFVLVVIIQYELFLGLWLFSGISAPVGLVFGILSFSVFGAVSGYQGWIGRASCGCLGRVHVNPWHTMSFDIGAVFILLLAYRSRIKLAPNETLVLPSLVQVSKAAGFFVIAQVLMGSLALLYFGSHGAALANLKGSPVSIDPVLLDLGNSKRAEIQRVSIQLTNLTGKPVRIVGGTSDCMCNAIQDLPLELPAWGVQTILVSVKWPAAPGEFTRRVVLYVDDGGFTTTSFQYTGRTVE